MHEHIIIISLDALGSEDFNRIKDTEGFAYLIENGGYSDTVRSVYPSLTYPAHTTIVTGKLPRNHGVINNTKLQPEREKPDWYWYKKDIHGGTIYDIAKNQKKTVAAFLWPVTGRSGITYNLPEILPVRFYQTQVGQVLQAGSPRFCLEIDKKFPTCGRVSKSPTWTTSPTKRPNTPLKSMPLHDPDPLCGSDSIRHKHGYDSPEAVNH